MIQSRLLGPEDWRLWRELRIAALTDSPAAFRAGLADWIGLDDTEERWRGLLASRPLNVVFSLDGEPVGTVSATAPTTEEEAVELHSMWIAPAARGHGVGDAAVQRVLAWAEREYPGRPIFLTVKADNAPAIRLYRRHGFTDIGTPADHPDERLMCR